ncbi:MAG TPA: molybdopterin-dependent oxidoreductase, partial [Polyangia bacterium]|nr:molybdopterin-dependent oxidoreductase [Polyangia bacterium]
MTSPPVVAGGVGALTATVAHVAHGPGLVRGTRGLLKMNQPDGFDCPGCAWPEPAAGERSLVEFCENGAKALAWEADRARADAAFFAQHAVAELAAADEYWLGQQGRLVEPMWLPEGGSYYQPIGWEDAFARIAGAIAALDGPEQAVFYTSGRTSNEAAFLYQLFVRELGTNNLPDCSNLCHESSGVALKQAVGVGKGTVQLEDFEHADVILIIGQNPGTNHPRMMTTLQAAARRGCQIVAINPLPEVGLQRFKDPQRPSGVVGRGTRIADHFLQVRLGGDLALLQAVARRVIAADDAAGGT